MSAILKVQIVKIGNSRGVRIPSIWLEQLALGEEAEMALESDQIVIRPVHQLRHNWEEQFRLMAANGDDRLLDEALATRWDEEAWEW